MRGMCKALAEKRGEEGVSAVSDEPVSGIHHQLREPTVVPVRVSEGCWGRRTVVRRRFGPAEEAFAELASGSVFVAILVPFRRHRNEEYSEKQRARERRGKEEIETVQN